MTSFGRFWQAPSIRLALVCMLLATVLLSGMHALVRLLSSDLHPFVIVFFRNLFGLLVMWPLFLRHGLSTLRTRNVALHGLRAAVGIFAMLAWFYALSRVPLANATALSFSMTLFASLWAWVFLKEIMRARRWAAILVGMAGVLLVLQPTMDGFNAFSLLVVFSSASWGASVVIVKRLAVTESATTIVAWMGISLTVLSLGPALSVWQTPNSQQLVLLLLVGLTATIGHLLMTRALQMADVAVVTSIDFSRLLWTALIGVLFFDERLDRWTLLGTIVVFASAWYVVFRESRHSHGEVSATGEVVETTQR